MSCALPNSILSTLVIRMSLRKKEIWRHNSNGIVNNNNNINKNYLDNDYNIVDKNWSNNQSNNNDGDSNIGATGTTTFTTTTSTKFDETRSCWTEMIWICWTIFILPHNLALFTSLSIRKDIALDRARMSIILPSFLEAGNSKMKIQSFWLKVSK